MKIYLLDINKDMCDAWHRCFDPATAGNIEIVNNSFAGFMSKHPGIEAIVSPANSFGLMNGGYDKAITDYFGTGLMKTVQAKILDKWLGLQPVGTSISVPIIDCICYKDYKKAVTYHPILIHTPTMIAPESIIDPSIVFHCMRSSIIEANNQGASSIVIPAFGGCAGKLSFDTIAEMMKLAYLQVFKPPIKLDWRYARHIHNLIMAVREGESAQ